MLLGLVDTCHHSNVTSLFLSIFEIIDSTIIQFWELDEVPSLHRFSSNEYAVETIDQKTTIRLNFEKCTAILSFQKAFPLLSGSKSVKFHRYHALEYRLNNNHFLRKQYIEFMQDYLTMGYMKHIP